MRPMEKVRLRKSSDKGRERELPLRAVPMEQMEQARGAADAAAVVIVVDDDGGPGSGFFFLATVRQLPGILGSAGFF